MSKLIGIVIALALFWPAMALAQFVHTWDAAFEAIPLDTDNVADGNEAINNFKVAVSERLEEQHQFGETGVDAFDTGRHREGSAWALRSVDCEAQIIPADDEAGRLCVTNGDQDLFVAVSGAAPGPPPPLWTRVVALPQHAIILWDQQINGDENCDGVLGPNECPCGFEEDPDFRNLTIRGADMGNTHADIPNGPGESCEEPGGMGTCTADPGMYDDTLDIAQMPGHDHDVDLGSNAGAAFKAVRGTIDQADATTSSTGDDDPHYHPFRTVLFCRKT